MGKIMKLIGCLVLVSIMVLSGFSGEGFAMEKKVVLRMAGQSPMEHVSTKHMFKLKEIVEKESNGSIELKLYPANQLGDYTQVYEELMRGSLDFALISISPRFNPKFQIDGIPFLIQDYADLGKYTARDGEYFKVMSSFTEENNVRLLGFHIDGFIGLGTTKTLVDPLDPTVAQDALIRIPNKETAKMFLTDVGYKTVSVPYAELFTALQTGVADGWWGGTANLNYFGFRDVIKNYYDLKLGLEQEYFLMSKRAWGKLNDEQKATIEDAVMEIEKARAEFCASEDATYMKKLEEHGVKVFRYTQEEMVPLVSFMKANVWPKYGKYIGQDLADALIEYFNN